MKSVPLYSVSMARNQGFSLVVGLIMLSLMTLLAVTTYIVGTNQTVVVANAQHRAEGIDAAQRAIAIVANSGNFAINPAAAIPASNCGSGANSWCVDSNGDGSSDYTVTLTPQPKCVTASVIPQSQINVVISPDDGVCTVFQDPSLPPPVDSLCANSIWEITAQAVDAATGTTVTVIQGLASRVFTNDIATNCP